MCIACVVYRSIQLYLNTYRILTGYIPIGLYTLTKELNSATLINEAESDNPCSLLILRSFYSKQIKRGI